MYRFSSLVLCVLVLTGCNLFRNTSKAKFSGESRLDASSTSTEHQNVSLRTSEIIELNSSDSSNIAFKTIIWPRGKFRLSLDSGFIGEADRIEQSAKKNSSAKTRNKIRKQSQLNMQLDQAATAELKRRDIVKTKDVISKPDSFPVLLVSGLIVLVILIAALFVFRKARRLNT